jgi:hypothetical protein
MPPDNTGYMVSAYVVAGVIYLAYTIRLVLQAKRVK